MVGRSCQIYHIKTVLLQKNAYFILTFERGRFSLKNIKQKQKIYNSHVSKHKIEHTIHEKNNQFGDILENSNLDQIYHDSKQCFVI